MPFISVASATADEADYVRFTINLSEASLGDVTVKYRTVQDGSALAGTDYTHDEDVLTILAGDTFATLEFYNRSDSLDKDARNFTLQLSDPVNADLDGGEPVLTATAVLLDNDGTSPDRALFVSDPIILEGSNGTKQAEFEIRLSEIPTSTLTLNYTTLDGTAKAGSDYAFKSGSLTFLPGQIVQTVTVNVTGDTTSESTEYFQLAVSPGASFPTGTADNVGIATLLDDDTSATLPEISLIPTEATEANYLYFQVILSEPSLGDVTVQYETVQDGSAISRSDYSYDSDVLTIPAGQTTGYVRVYNNSNSADQDDRNVTMQLSDPTNAVLAGGAPVLKATGVFLDNDGTSPDQSLFVSDPIILEGDSGSREAVFEVRLSEPPTTTVTLSYTTRDGTAQAGSDYTATTGTVTFVEGQTVAVVYVPVLGDLRNEVAESFSLLVTPVAGIANMYEDSVGVATILNDDGSDTLPEISILPSRAPENDYTYFNVFLSAPSLSDVTVTYETVFDGAAALRYDYRHEFDKLTIPAGETVASFRVYNYDFNNDEDDRNITVQLSDPQNAILSGGEPVLTATGIQFDRDGVTNDLALSVSDPIIMETDSGTKEAVFEVRLSSPSPLSIDLDYTTADGTALAGQDYVATSGTLSFAPGQTLTTVRVQVNGDTLPETPEVFSLVVTPTLAIASGFADSTGMATILDDDTSGALPELNLLSTQTYEGDYLYYQVILSEPSLTDIKVDYSLLNDGSASTSNFYQDISGTLTIPAGETVSYVAVRAYGFSGDNDDLNVTFLLTNPQNAVLAGGENRLTATGVILDASGTTLDRSLFVSDPVIREGDQGNRFAVFEVRLSEPASTTIALDYMTVDGTAAAGRDYVGLTGTVTFRPGQTVSAVHVPIIADSIKEDSESFSLVVTPTLAIANGVADSVGTATLINDDDGVIRGTPGADNLVGTFAQDIVYGGDSTDTIYGGNGPDEIRGGLGNDKIYGGDGSDSLYGDQDNDEMEGNAGRDRMYGSSGNDLMKGGNDNDNMFGGTGDDSLYGWTGVDIMRGDDGQDVLYGENDNDRMSGGAGNDVMYGGNDNDQMTGWVGNDTLYGGNGNDNVYGSNDNDLIYGGNNDDRLFGGNHNDRVYGGASRDTVQGNGGRDTLFGDDGDDLVQGGSGNDLVYGGAGNDVLTGWTGSDRLFGGSGADLLTGHNGADDFVFDDGDTGRTATTRDTITDFKPGFDDIDLRPVDANSRTAADDAFDYSGTSAAANSVWHRQSGRDTIVYADTNGDARSDLQILLEGVNSLTRFDFIL